MQLIEELPFGLAICAANGETATLTGLSDRQMRLRTHGAEPLSSLAVRFLTDDRASYVACPVDGWRVSHEERTRLGVLRMVDVPCPAFAKEARRALKDVAMVAMLQMVKQVPSENLMTYNIQVAAVVVIQVMLTSILHKQSHTMLVANQMVQMEHQ